MTFSDRQALIKKLLYQSCNRGCKETDLILGQFAKAYLSRMTASELITFTELLAFNDNDLYEWYIGRQTVPLKYQSTVMTKLLNFKLSS